MNIENTATRPLTLCTDPEHSPDVWQKTASLRTLCLAVPASRPGGSLGGSHGMFKRLLPSVSLVCLALHASVAQAQDYYVCDCQDEAAAECLAGDDAADGTSPATAWRTYDKAQDEFGKLQPGDSLLFCDGGAFLVENGSRWVNSNCQAAEPCVVADYRPSWADETAPRPLIWGKGNGHAFALEDGGAANHEEGYVFRNLELRCTVCDQKTSNWGFFLYNDIDDVLIENVVIDSFGIGVHAAGSNGCDDADPKCDGRISRLVIRNSVFKNNHSQGFLGAADDSVIEGSIFENNGTAAILDHNLYVGGNSTGMTIRGNDLFRSSVRAQDACAAVSLVVHGHHENLLIENNVVHEELGKARPTCWGIAVDTGYDKAEEFKNVVIRGNRVINVGNVGIGVSSCVDCTIEDNVVIQEQSHGTTAIAVPDRDRGANDAVETAVQVRNNSIYMTGPGVGIKLGREGTDHLVVSNAIHLAGGEGARSCMALDLDKSAYQAVDYNICFFPDGSGGQWESGTPGAPDPLAVWQMASGFDSHSQFHDPGFNAAAGPSWDLSAASELAAMVDAGHPTWSAPTDIAGKPRDAQPDVGAFELPAEEDETGGTSTGTDSSGETGQGESDGDAPTGTGSGESDGDAPTGTGPGGENSTGAGQGESSGDSSSATGENGAGDAGGCGCVAVGTTHGARAEWLMVATALLLRRRGRGPEAASARRHRR